MTQHFPMNNNSIQTLGTPLHITVKKNLITKFQDIIQEGNLYSIKNLKIETANETYKPIKGTIKAWLLSTTTVTKFRDSSIIIPQHYFDFASLETISERVGDRIILTGNKSHIKKQILIGLKMMFIYTHKSLHNYRHHWNTTSCRT